MLQCNTSRDARLTTCVAYMNCITHDDVTRASRNTRTIETTYDELHQMIDDVLRERIDGYAIENVHALQNARYAIDVRDACETLKSIDVACVVATHARHVINATRAMLIACIDVDARDVSRIVTICVHQICILMNG